MPMQGIPLTLPSSKFHEPRRPAAQTIGCQRVSGSRRYPSASLRRRAVGPLSGRGHSSCSSGPPISKSYPSDRAQSAGNQKGFFTMCDKRFSKLLLVVLALALWAGTAYGQALTASPTTWTTTYTIGQDVSTVQTTVGVTAASNGTGYTVASDSLSWLTCTASSGTANIAPGENITIAVIDAGADSLTPGSNSGSG